MQIGTYWYMDAKLSLEANILAAKKYYEEKFFETCNCCLMNPKDIPEAGLPSIPGVFIHVRKGTLPQHIWVGNEDSPNKPVERKSLTTDK